jgi:hypothetical protein
MMTSFIGRSITYNLLYLSASNVSVIYLLPTNHSQSGSANVLIISRLSVIYLHLVIQIAVNWHFTTVLESN